ncbi:MAG TPA: 50S ribosomal protein L19e [Nitrososphaerales archaeon]|nr:50S ribosomal protein L19e [Nitrososphaerales archaeon]
MPVNMRDKRELAARLLDVGANRIKFDPKYLEDIADAITRENIRSLVTARTVLVKGVKGTSRGRARAAHLNAKKRGRGHGSKKGAKGARMGKKQIWVKKVRAMRHRIKVMKSRGDISKAAFWSLYTKINGGQVRSLAHLRELVNEVSSKK